LITRAIAGNANTALCALFDRLDHSPAVAT
jgi:hypothetical protein